MQSQMGRCHSISTESSVRNGSGLHWKFSAPSVRRPAWSSILLLQWFFTVHSRDVAYIIHASTVAVFKIIVQTPETDKSANIPLSWMFQRLFVSKSEDRTGQTQQLAGANPSAPRHFSSWFMAQHHQARTRSNATAQTSYTMTMMMKKGTDGWPEQDL